MSITLQGSGKFQCPYDLHPLQKTPCSWSFPSQADHIAVGYLGLSGRNLDLVRTLPDFNWSSLLQDAMCSDDIPTC
jgi:hypothetical protein